MNSKTRAVAACAILIGALVHAQETVTFDVRFSDPVLVPGEVQYIEVWCEFAPTVGAPAVWNQPGANPIVGTVLAFATAQFNLVNVTGGQTGVYANLLLNPALSLGMAGWEGTPDKQGNVIGMLPWQLPNGPMNPANPILLWTATWTPNTYDPRTVEFTTEVMLGPSMHLHTSQFAIPLYDEWTPLHVPASFQVIPAPATLIVPAALGALRLTRRRREA
ncbi:MAG: hypothetical protein ACKVU4_14380 [Phycisphaerales bacterium]